MRLKMARPELCSISLATALTLLPAVTAAADLDLRFERAPVPFNNYVQFNRVGIDSDGVPRADNPISESETDDGYHVALVDTHHRPNQRYFTYEFIVWQITSPSRRSRVLINVASTGRFPDLEQEVEFTVLAANNASAAMRRSQGRIIIPIHPSEPFPLCRVADGATSSTPFPVFLGVRNDYRVTLDCSEAAFLVSLLTIDIQPPSD
jgi:hypothetical protein